MRRNYHRKLSASICISSRKKFGNYRDTGAKKREKNKGERKDREA